MLINEAVLHILDKNSGNLLLSQAHCNWATHFSLNTLQNS